MLPKLAAILRSWQPFRIDALGLVTILGTHSADRVLGQLTTNRFVDWLPMLGSHVIANNQITDPLPSFSLYNITDGMVATDLAGWFSRWLMCQDFTDCSSIITITLAPPSAAKRQYNTAICAAAFGSVSLAPIVVPAVIGDWWGFANGIAMLISILVRQIVVRQNRFAIDSVMEMIQNTPDQHVKIFANLPNGKAVTILTTREIVIECLLTGNKPPNPKLYHFTRSLGWLAFGIHIVALGMACLVCQLLAVALMILSTVIACQQIGTDREHIGRRLKINRTDDELPFRAATYSRLDLTREQERSMVQWSLFPHKSNKAWWKKYKKIKAERNFEKWDKILPKID